MRRIPTYGFKSAAHQALVTASRRGLVEEPPLIQHSAGLVIDAHPTPSAILQRNGRTKIIATIGPASANPDVLDGMIRNGMNVARFNMSHGSHSEHHRAMNLVRHRALQLREHVALALDTKGPEVRLGLFEQPAPSAASAAGAVTPISGAALDAIEPAPMSVSLQNGQRVTVTMNPERRTSMTNTLLYVDYPGLLSGPSRPTHFLLGDGAVELAVEDVNLQAGELRCYVTRGATIFDRSNVHVIGAEVALPLVSEQDELDLSFGVANDIDLVFASFVRSAQQIHELRGILGTRGRKVGIVAKIETTAALKELDSIIDAADGVMVARGDLGVALPIERAFFAQKKIIAACNIAGKPVICATQMLESMIRSKRPTRAETTDVANAVIDGADALMLSAESARGEHPEITVATLNRIATEATSFIRHRKRFSDIIATMNRDEVQELGADTTRSVSFKSSASHVVQVAPRSAAAAAAAHEVERQNNLVRATLPRTIGYIAEAAVLTSFECGARCIVTATVSGNSVRKLRQCCPSCPIVAVCKTPGVARQLSLVRGVIPLYFETVEYENFEGLVDAAVNFLKEPASGAAGRIQLDRGDLVVVTCTDSTDPTDFTAFLKIRVVQ